MSDDLSSFEAPHHTAVKIEPPPQKEVSVFRSFSSEFVGTFVLCAFGTGVNAQVTLSRGEAGRYLSVAFGWAMGIIFGAYTSAGVSGGHMNPAVTIALAVHKQFPWKRVPIYIAAQVFGAFMASALVYGDYIDALDNFDGGIRQVTGPNGTAGIWATIPAPWLSLGNGFFDQMVGTGFLLAGLFALNDEANSAPKSQLRPILAGMLVFAIGTSFGLNDGYAINPARDFGPRVFTAMTHGGEVFSGLNNWWWIPIIAPVIGAIIGSSFYVFMVKYQHPISPSINMKIR